MIGYSEMHQGRFVSRPNRFLADVAFGAENGEEIIRCHVKNTGRLREILRPGVPVWCEYHDDPKRKTRYSLITAEHPAGGLVNLDSQVPNAAAEEWVRAGMGGRLKELQSIKREKRFGDSRFDLYFQADEKEYYMEVKGVTLNIDGMACFPDAPTERGAKHVRELIRAKEAGFEAYLLFVIAMKNVSAFRPNDEKDPEFAAALREAAEKGVKLLACDCRVTEDTIEIDKELPVVL